VSDDERFVAIDRRAARMDFCLAYLAYPCVTYPICVRSDVFEALYDRPYLTSFASHPLPPSPLRLVDRPLDRAKIQRAITRRALHSRRLLVDVPLLARNFASNFFLELSTRTLRDCSDSTREQSRHKPTTSLSSAPPSSSTSSRI